MAKTISKAEAIRILNQIESLEVLSEVIDRNETDSSKQTKVNRFINSIQKQIHDQRDVLIISVKVK